MHLRKVTIPITTDSTGAATAYSDIRVTGRILSVQYVKTDFANGVDVDITSEDTGQTILDKDDVNASVLYCPRQPTHSTAGAAALYASGGTAVNDYLYVVGERIKIVIGSGGDTKSGKFVITIG